jgi:hypothetical protein
MKNKQKGIVLCGLMLATLLPITTVGAVINARSAPETCGFFDKTIIYGFAVYLGRDATGRTTHLYALRLRYITISLSGERDIGFIRLRKIDVPTRMTGYNGHFFIAASFRGSIDI